MTTLTDMSSEDAQKLLSTISSTARNERNPRRNDKRSRGLRSVGQKRATSYVKGKKQGPPAVAGPKLSCGAVRSKQTRRRYTRENPINHSQNTANDFPECGYGIKKTRTSDQLGDLGQ